MSTKDQAIALAQRDADKSGKTHLVFNLNPFGALWVVREFHEKLARQPNVIIVTPGGIQ